VLCVFGQVDGEVDGEAAKVTKTKGVSLLGNRSTADSGAP